MAIRISAPLSARVSLTGWNHQSSQIIRPRRNPRKATGPGAGPGSKTRLSSETPVFGTSCLARRARMRPPSSTKRAL